MKHALLLVTFFAVWGPAQAATVSLNAGSEQYLYFETDWHTVGSYNGTPQVSNTYLENQGYTYDKMWGFYAFDLAAVADDIQSASVSIYLGTNGYNSFRASETLQIVQYDYVRDPVPQPYDYEFDNPPGAHLQSLDEAIAVIDTLRPGWNESSAMLAATLPYLNCPGSCDPLSIYGATTVTSSDQGSWLNIELNAAGLADLQSSAGGKFALYLQLAGDMTPAELRSNCATTAVDAQGNTYYIDGGYLVCDERSLFDADTLGTASLQVTTVPLPPALLLFPSALALLGFLRKRKFR